MEAIARYRSTDRQGHAHLITEYEDRQWGRWLELSDGDRVFADGTGGYMTATGKAFAKLTRGS